MPVGFPPQPVYPFALDSNRTLFLVFNTSEAALAADNAAWADEIDIVPVGDDEPEQWGDNGFANLDGELLYYDAVEKNDAGKIVKFKRVCRAIGNSKTKFNPAIGPCGATIIRGYVIAEHHNQLVDAVIATEQFLLDLEDQINILIEEPVCVDDSFCPEVDFKFDVNEEESGNCVGTFVEFEVEINGQFTSFRLDFGDGESTSERSGTHTYPPNSTIDPVVTVTNERCSVVQTAITRTEPTEPPVPDDDETFRIPIPPPPDFPNIVLPDIDPPTPQIELPQIVFPCLDVGPIGPIDIPSIIVVVPPINIPSIIVFGPVDIPSLIFFVGAPSFSPIAFGPAPSFSPIAFGPAPSFSPIAFGPAPSFSPIGFGPAPSFSPIAFGPAPSFAPIAFGPAPYFAPIGFGPAPSFSPIGFGPAPSFAPIGFGPAPSFAPIGFGPAPSFSPIAFGPAPSFSPIAFGPAPSFSPIGFGPAPSFSPIAFGPAPTFSPIAFGPAPSFSPIAFGPAPTFSPIAFGPAPSFSPIAFGPAPTFSPIAFGPAPTVSVDWGTPPTCSCTVTVSCPGSSPLRMQSFAGEDEFLDGFDPVYEVNNEELGIPNEIKIIAPQFPNIKVVHELPLTIGLAVPEIPNIKLEIPTALPKEIKVVSDAVLPSSIRLESGDLPKSIRLDFDGLPESIRLEVPNFPSIIKVDASGIPDSIQVKGIPDSIEVKMPTEIIARLELPENLEVPLVYKGGPVPIQFDTSNLFGNGDHPCFALVPCSPK